MVRDFDNSLREHFGNLMNEALQELRFNNCAFAELEECNARLYRKVEKIMEGLPDEGKKTMKEFIDTSGMVAEQEADYMYYQGMKHCIRFLKFLQVI